jgi:FkbM family methyltransferase
MEPLNIKSVRDIGLTAGSYTRSSALVRKLGWFVYRPYVLTLFQKLGELGQRLDELQSNVNDLRQDSEALRRDSEALRQDSDALRRDSDALQRDSDALQRDSDALRRDSAKARLGAAEQESMIQDVQVSAATLGAQFQEQDARLSALTETQVEYNALARDHLHNQKAIGIDLHAVQNRLLDLETKTAVVDRIQSLEPSLTGIAQQAAELRAREALEETQATQRVLRDEANENRLRQIEATLAQLTAGLNDVLSRTMATSRPTPTIATGLEIPNTHFYLYEGPYGRFMLRRHDLISDAISRGEFWDPHLESVIREAATRGGTAIDAGAYFGFISVQLAKAFGRVISFEPQLEIFQNLNTNLMLNGCHNAVTHNMGLYSKPGFLSLASPDLQDIEIPRTNGFVDYDACPNAAAVAFEFADQPEPSRDEASAIIRATTIDSLNLDDVSFIKIDCQGADYHVLLGAKETIQRSRPVIVFESEHYLEEGRSITRNDYETLLSRLGYTMWPLSNKGDGKQVDYLAVPASRAADDS